MALTTTTMAPIFKLPVEIFAEIFRRAVEGEISHLTSGKSPVPASLSFVCRLWREIALGLPDLWASIAFDTQANMKIALPELLDLYLSRSRNAPLCIRGTLLRDCDSLSFDSILPEHGAICRAIAGKPRHGCDRALRHFLAPSEQITALTAYTADLRFTTILARAHRNLRHLTLRDWRCPLNFISAPPLALRTLCLIQDVDRSALAASLSHVFTRLVLPQLHSLHIEGPAKAQGERCLDWDVLAFAVMAQRITPCPLTTLRLVHVHMSAADLVTALLALPLLENLTIVEAHHGHGHSHSLAVAPISDTFLTSITWPCLACPELRTLRLGGRLGFDDQRLVEMVRSRRGSHDGAGAGQDLGAGQLGSLRSVAELRALALVARNLDRLRVLKSRLVVLMTEDPAFDLDVVAVAEDTLGTGAPCADCQRF
ncbi:hypothetical protein LshimejAT787_2600450 [Lyophyllum shimeji]|uniref:F-box domain-containing protein n=1 Tax=Lyophyllum shimeji TaxID=47721 RepID=A0A9P3PZ19_LYOSH|nr:hypothetical protein LshimejAT787_2600450 [Lyophyllum shimeji]